MNKKAPSAFGKNINTPAGKEKGRRPASSLKRLLSYLKPQAFFVVLSFVLSAAAVSLTLYMPVLIGRAVDCIVGTGNVDFTAMKAIVIRMIITISATAVCQWCCTLINNSISMGTARRLRRTKIPTP